MGYRDYEKCVTELITNHNFDAFLNNEVSYWDWFANNNLASFGFYLSNGASRMVIYHEDWDFVLKVGYDTADGVDYCANEQFLYSKAMEWGIESAFAFCDYVGKFGNYDIYVMERCVCDEDAMSDSSYDLQYSRFCAENNLDPDAVDSADKFYDDFGDEYEEQYCMFELAAENWSPQLLTQVTNFFDEYHINDCHCGNWGWRGRQLIVVDYAGYGDEAYYIANKRREEWQ